MLANTFDSCVRRRWYQPLEYEYMKGCAAQSMLNCDIMLLLHLHDREMLRTLLRSGSPELVLDHYIGQMQLAGFYGLPNQQWHYLMPKFFER